MKADFLAAKLPPLPDFPVKRASPLVFSLLAIYVWILPIGHTIFIRNLAFFSLLGVTFWLTYRKEIKLSWPLLLPWAIYGAVSLFSLFYAINPAYSFGEIKKEIGYAALALMLGATWIRGLPSLSWLVFILVMGDILLVAAALGKAFILFPLWLSPSPPQYDALYNGVGNFSTYLIMVLPFIVAFTLLLPAHHRAWQKWLWGLILANIVALELTSNRMGMLVTSMEVLFSAITWWAVSRSMSLKQVVTVIFICLSLVFALVPTLESRMNPNEWAVTTNRGKVTTAREAMTTALVSNTASSDPRWTIWNKALANICERPFTGGGFGREAFKMRNYEFWKSHGLQWHAHNMVLNKGVQMGLPGMAAFIFLLLATLRKLWPSRNLYLQSGPKWVYALAATTMSFGLFMKNMTDDFFVNDIAFLYWLLVGAVIGHLSTKPSAEP
jgi:O-antigen ligase